MLSWEEGWLFQRSVTPGGDPKARPASWPSCGAPTDSAKLLPCERCHEPVPFLTTGWLVTGQLVAGLAPDRLAALQ